MLSWDTVHLATDAELLAALAALPSEPGPVLTHGERLLTDQLFNQAARRRLRVPLGIVLRLLGVQPYRDRAVRLCVWCLDRGEALELLRPLLDDADTRMSAVWALGTLKDNESADRLLALLEEVEPGAHSGHLLVALARLDTPQARHALAQRAAHGQAPEIYFLARALRHLTGHAPLSPEPGAEPLSRDTQLAAMREYWHRADPDTRPAPRVNWRLRGPAGADVAVEHGRDVFALDDVHPDAAGSWPLWSVGWVMGGRELFEVGSNCSTCEVYLRRTGWAPTDAIAFAQSIRGVVGDVPALTPRLLTAFEPVLAGCATGRYDVRLVDVRLWATHDQGDTWYGDRGENLEDVEPVSTTATLYAGLSTTGVLSALTIVATQPDTALDEHTVAEYADVITAGVRPVVVAAAHAADRYVVGSNDRVDRSVTAFVIDGHHKLAAYDRLGLPARVILLCDLEPRLHPGTADVAGLFDTVLSGVAVPVS